MFLEFLFPLSFKGQANLFQDLYSLQSIIFREQVNKILRFVKNHFQSIL